MAVTTEIPWGDGSSDKIYLTRDASEGNQQVLVSSDANTGAARSKVVTFSASGASPVTLTVSQAAGAVSPVFYDLLVFDGTAYVQTDLSLPASCSILVNLGNETQKAGQRYFGSYASGGSIAAGLRSTTNSTRRVFNLYYDSSSAISSSTTLNFTYTNFSFWMTPSRWGWGNVSHNYSKGSSHPSTAFTLGNYTGGGGSGFTGQAGTCYIYGSDASGVSSSSGFSSYTPVYTLRPCTYGGVAGLWCEENGKFYGNSAASGTLTVLNNA